MLGSLSYMLETDLYSDDKNTFTLAEEVEYIRQYSKIIRCKYNDKIRIILDIPEEFAGQQDPKLILQPLLENAMKHGFAKSLDVAMLVIVAKEQNGKLLLQLCDNGVGMEKEVSSEHFRRKCTGTGPGAYRDPEYSAENPVFVWSRIRA